MQLRRTLALGASALVLSAACGESHMGEEDAAIVFDATFPDAGMDAGPPPSNFGAACAADDECVGGSDVCLTEDDWQLPEGYCSAFCSADVECAAGATCVSFGGGMSVCLDSCDPSADDQCRTGYGCSLELGSCFPGCEDDSDCGAGEVCLPGGGGLGSGSCHDPDAQVGDSCGSPEDCAPTQTCIDERFNNWPAGACVGLDCDPVANTGCEGDAVCAASTGGGGLCVDGCTTDEDCRPAYRCGPLGDDETRMACIPGCTEDSQCIAETFGGTRYVCNPGTGYCTRPLDPEEIGEPCTGGFRECRGGRCLTEDGSGWPAGMCTYPGCSLTGASPSATCPTGTVCTDDGGNPDLGVCVPGCTVGGTDCRSGYACLPTDPGVADGPTACLPACDTSSCAAGNTCNTTTGLCA